MTHGFNRVPAFTPAAQGATTPEPETPSTPAQSGAASLLFALAVCGGTICIAVTLFTAVFAP